MVHHHHLLLGVSFPCPRCCSCCCSCCILVLVHVCIPSYHVNNSPAADDIEPVAARPTRVCGDGSMPRRWTSWMSWYVLVLDDYGVNVDESLDESLGIVLQPRIHRRSSPRRSWRVNLRWVGCGVIPRLFWVTLTLTWVAAVVVGRRILCTCVESSSSRQWHYHSWVHLRWIGEDRLPLPC